MDNYGQPIEIQVILDLHREMLARFQGFTIHPTSQGRWQSRAGQLYQEEVVVYEVAVPEDRIVFLRNAVCELGRRLKQLAMYFDSPAPSVEIIDLSDTAEMAAADGGKDDEAKHPKATGRRSKKNRPPS
jgi:hypothetical protein